MNKNSENGALASMFEKCKSSSKCIQAGIMEHIGIAAKK
jgi:hypothetical protein